MAVTPHYSGLGLPGVWQVALPHQAGSTVQEALGSSSQQEAAATGMARGFPGSAAAVQEGGGRGRQLLPPPPCTAAAGPRNLCASGCNPLLAAATQSFLGYAACLAGLL